MSRFLKELPTDGAERAVRIFCGRWKIHLLWHIAEGPKRLSELKLLIPDAVEKTLIQQLKELEAHGVVSRKVYAEVPLRVEYSITNQGRALRPIILSLCDWGKKHKTAVQ